VDQRAVDSANREDGCHNSDRRGNQRIAESDFQHCDLPFRDRLGAAISAPLSLAFESSYQYP
jgi:hypothetical protein